jgi:acetamidase/formamidase
VGPFSIEGAAPGDTLVVRIVRLTPNRDVAVSNVRPNGISGVAADSRTRLLNEPRPSPAGGSSGGSIGRA